MGAVSVHERSDGLSVSYRVWKVGNGNADGSDNAVLGGWNMEITKTVPVTIEIGEVGCSEHCQFFEDLGDGELGCRRYGDISERRHPACLAEFGTGDVVNSSVKLIDCPVCKGRGRWEFRPQNWVPCQTCRRTGVVEVVVSDKQVAEFGTGEGENG